MSLRRLLRRAAAPSHSNYRIRLTPKWQAALSSSGSDSDATCPAPALVRDVPISLEGYARHVAAALA